MSEIVDIAVGIFADQLKPWSPRDLQDAVRANRSLARELQVHQGTQLTVWRSMAAPFKMLNRREYDQFLRDLTYQRVIQEVRRANPALARAVETTPGANIWLLTQIRECKQLFQ